MSSRLFFREPILPTVSLQTDLKRSALNTPFAPKTKRRSKRLVTAFESFDSACDQSHKDACWKQLTFIAVTILKAAQIARTGNGNEGNLIKGHEIGIVCGWQKTVKASFDIAAEQETCFSSALRNRLSVPFSIQWHNTLWFKGFQRFYVLFNGQSEQTQKQENVSVNRETDEPRTITTKAM